LTPAPGGPKRCVLARPRSGLPSYQSSAICNFEKVLVEFIRNGAAILKGGHPMNRSFLPVFITCAFVGIAAIFMSSCATPSVEPGPAYAPPPPGPDYVPPPGAPPGAPYMPPPGAPPPPGAEYPPPPGGAPPRRAEYPPPPGAQGRPAGGGGLREACRMDLQRFCASVPSGQGRKVQCLTAHQKKLSMSCKSFLGRRGA
jgi:hypothetical protein